MASIMHPSLVNASTGITLWKMCSASTTPCPSFHTSVINSSFFDLPWISNIKNHYQLSHPTTAGFSASWRQALSHQAVRCFLRTHLPGYFILLRMPCRSRTNMLLSVIGRQFDAFSNSSFLGWESSDCASGSWTAFSATKSGSREQSVGGRVLTVSGIRGYSYLPRTRFVHSL